MKMRALGSSLAGLSGWGLAGTGEAVVADATGFGGSALLAGSSTLAGNGGRDTAAAVFCPMGSAFGTAGGVAIGTTKALAAETGAAGCGPATGTDSAGLETVRELVGRDSLGFAC